MKKAAKGQHGYVQYEKKKRFLVMLLMFAIPLLIFITGIAAAGSRNNVFTVIAIVGIIPAARFAVSFIMMAMQKPVEEALVKATDQAAGRLVHAYEMTFTIRDGQLPADALVIGHGSVAVYSPRGKKEMVPKIEDHLEKALATGGHRGMKAKVFQNEKSFLERVSSMAEKEPDREHDEAVLITLKAISL